MPLAGGAATTGTRSAVAPHAEHGAGPERGNRHYCDGCTPPLIYTNGPVMDATSTDAVTITAIYWDPGEADASNSAFPPGYEDALDGYITNVAAASGRSDNVYSVLGEYYSLSKGVKTDLAYNLEAATPLVDTANFPSGGCRPGPDDTACVTDAQLRAELGRVRRAENLPSGFGTFYLMFFPPNVKTVDRDGSNSNEDFCGYHRASGEGPTVLIYANIPYEASGCDAGQKPNGSFAIDAAISTVSHELTEAVSDPVEPIAWEDSSGNEMADICANSYGPPLGSTDPDHPGVTEYNQLINGGKYYTQTEFSNYAFATYGTGHGCVQSESQAQKAPPGDQGSGRVSSVFADATPTQLPANGTGKSSVEIIVGDSHGYGIGGDPVHFQVYPRSGTGVCGRLSRTQTTTADDGSTTVTYRASRSNVVCAIDAVEGDGGRLAESIVYQGTTRREAPTLHAKFPASLVPGTTTTFTITLHNPYGKPVTGARLDVSFFPGTAKSPNVRASQIQLSYSTHGPNGFFKPIALSGSTGNDGEIEGYPGVQAGAVLGAHQTRTYTFHIKLAPNVPLSSSGRTPLLAIEAYLDQIDSASGSGTTLDDSYASNISVTG